jgi:hypothetical protein
MTITILTEFAESIREHNQDKGRTPFNSEHVLTLAECIGNPRKRKAFIDYTMGWTSKERFLNDIKG